MICWFDDVLLILIRGFAWFRVDLASTQVSPPSIHEISSILPRKSPNFRPKIHPREEIPSSLTCPDHPDLLPDHPDTFRISWTLSRTSGYPTHPENRTGADEPGSSGCTPGSSGPSPDHPDLLPDVRLTLTLTRLNSCFDHN